MERLEINHRLAALALFRELYNSDKSVYAILQIFIEYVAFKFRKIEFTATDISGWLKTEFNFMIPDAVALHACDKYCPNISKIRKGVFSVASNSELQVNFDNTNQEIDKLNKNTDLIIERIYSFCSNFNFVKNLSEEDVKNEIGTALYNFCLGNGHNNLYSDVIGAFLIENETNTDLVKIISEIREGVILYTGVRYTDTSNPMGKWDKSLTLYLDTEILFSAYGYNGDIEKKVFDEFFELVKEVNKSSIKRDIIRLRYFEETRIEINKYFEVACEVINGKATTYPGISAMPKIVEGCCVKSDIKDKLSEFIDYLNNTLKIEEEKTTYYEQQYNQFNIDEKGLFEYFKEKYPTTPDENIQKALKSLNYVNIRRKGVNNLHFDNASYFFVTGKNLVMSIAADEKVKLIAPTFWATTINFLTNRIWFRLNKGFGKGVILPTAFNVVASAKVLLASQMNSKVSKGFAKLREDAEKGKLTEDQVRIQYAGYRQDTIDADNINSENAPDVLADILSDEYYEKHLREESLLRQTIESLTDDSAKKNKALDEANTIIEELKIRYDNTTLTQQKRINSLLVMTVSRLEEEKKFIGEKLSIIDKKIINTQRIFKSLQYTISGIFIITIFVLCCKFGINNIASIITIVLLIAQLLFSYLLKATRQILSSRITKIIDNKRRRLLKAYNLTEDSLANKQTAIDQLKQELDENTLSS